MRFCITQYRRSSVDSKSVLSSQRTSRTRIFQSRRTSEQYISRTRMTERPKSPQGLEEKDPSSTIPPLSMLEPPSSPGRRLFTVKQKQHAYFLLDDPLVHPEMLSRRASEICTHSSKVARKDLKDHRRSSDGSPRIHVDTIAEHDMEIRESSNSPPMQLERANSVLLEAIRHGDKSTVENMLSTGTSVNATTKDGLTALHVAVNSSADSVVRLLLSKKANSLATSTDLQTPLHLACTKPPGNAAATEIIKVLIRSSGKESKSMTDKNGDTPLFLAVQSGNVIAVRELLSTGQAEQQVKQTKSENGDNVLHMAARKREPEAAKLLVQWGAEIDAENDDGQTPMHIAAYEGDDLMVRTLHGMRARADLKDIEDRTPLLLAAMRGHTTVVDYLLDKARADINARSKDGNTLLHLACLGGHSETCTSIMKRGVPLRMPNKNGSLCIHNAAKKGHVTVVKALLEKGVPIDAKNKENMTPLHMAITFKRLPVVQLLLGYGADKEMRGGKDCEPAIHMAARVKGGEKAADILIRSGANPETKNESNGERALHVAARNGNLEVVELLLQENVEVARRSRNGETPLHQASANGYYEIAKMLVEKLFKNKSFSLARLIINIPNDKGETALHQVCCLVKRNNNRETVVKIAELLLENGAIMSLETYQRKENPLHWVAKSGNHEVLEAMLTSTAVPLHIIQSGINSTTEIGASPLMLAGHHGNLEVVKVLLKHNARVDVFDETGSTALHHSASFGHVDIAIELLTHKAYVNGRTKIGLSPLHLAAEKGYTTFVKSLVTKFNAVVDSFTMDNRTPLHFAAEKGHVDVCRLLIDLRADPAIVDSHGMIPVHYAALYDHDEAVELFHDLIPESMTQVNNQGMTAMLLAASTGSIRVIRKLVSINFAQCLTDKTVLSRPLLLAARNGHTEVVEFLLESGASATQEDSDGMSVMLLASKFGQIKVVNMLWDMVSIDIPSSKTGLTAVHIAALYGQLSVLQEVLSRAPQTGTFISQNPKEKEEGIDQGFTPLHLAAQNGDPAMIRLLMNHPGVKMDATTKEMERTALHYAALGGHIEVVSTLISKSTAPLHMRDKHGYTPLHMAAANGYKELVALLIGQGSDINAVNEDGNTPIHLAAEAGCLTVTRLLTEYGASTVCVNNKKGAPICLAARRRNLDVVEFLLTQQLDHEKLSKDKAFLLDLVICARKVDQKPLKTFVLSAPAPVHVSSQLAHYFSNEANKNKEYLEALREASMVCQSMSNHLITVSCADNSEVVLNSLDAQNTAFLDFLITCDQKECVSHSIVQQYVTEIWYGELNWADWKFILLFLVALIFPPLWVYLSLPVLNRYQYIPIIKFICQLISHLYLIVLLAFTVVVPWEQSAANLLPRFYEWMLVVWISGIFLSELTAGRERKGLNWIPVLVVFLSLIGIACHIIAVFLDDMDRVTLIFARNQILALAMVLCVVQLLEFLSIHQLFGPWGVIIGHLVVDVLRFLVIMLLFIVGFALQLAAVYKPIDREENGYHIKTINQGFVHICELLFFALFGLTNQSDNLATGSGYPSGAHQIAKAVFGVYNVLCMIILINLLIAMMSDTYQRLQEKSDVEWKYGRAKLIRSMELQVSQPPPINLFTHIVHLARVIYKVRCNCCRTNIINLMRDNQQKHSAKRRRASRKSKVDTELLQLRLESGRAGNSSDNRIYSVVDWPQMVDKYLDITGEKAISKKKNITMAKNALGAPMGGPKDEKLDFQQTIGLASQKISIVNKLRV
ncbi:serine/threonine-protein phosphatase 6 regulatory ankyrin repeat subunit C isoform X3 [Nematostella vectensis]|uniref:serine/threonine-protein phosphatase 6 regulatory ankyrin repeat subunit C isoform X3 n=1 Tax=Nematostella vectensis TaxID=45351 RepID=UPI0020772852|nr:serine/threonine-protein phosphatase 6 regulatory ankyrin repeat subunit C isoform X3 [Nematostella vectensis]